MRKLKTAKYMAWQYTQAFIYTLIEGLFEDTKKKTTPNDIVEGLEWLRAGLRASAVMSYNEKVVRSPIDMFIAEGEVYFTTPPTMATSVSIVNETVIVQCGSIAKTHTNVPIYKYLGHAVIAGWITRKRLPRTLYVVSDGKICKSTIPNTVTSVVSTLRLNYEIILYRAYLAMTTELTRGDITTDTAITRYFKLVDSCHTTQGGTRQRNLIKTRAVRL
jgi:hypothetical protein